MSGTAYAPFEYKCDAYLITNEHIIKISKRHDKTNYASCLYFTKDNNSEIVGSFYIEDKDPGSTPAMYYISPGGTFVNGKGQLYDLLFFKKAPEGDFKTWLENNCRRIL